MFSSVGVLGALPAWPKPLWKPSESHSFISMNSIYAPCVSVINIISNPILCVFTCMLKKRSQTGENGRNVTFFTPSSKSRMQWAWICVGWRDRSTCRKGLPASWALPQPPKSVTQGGVASTATSSVWQHWHQGCQLNRGLQLETCRGG